MQGGNGADVFVFTDGHDTITKFDPLLDTIDLTAFSTDFGTLHGLMSVVDSSVRFTFNADDVLTIEGLSELDVNAGLFVF